MRALLIDDNPSVSFLHSMLLKKHFHNIDLKAEEDAAEALNTLSHSLQTDKEPYGLILLDLNMPGMDGWEFLEEYHARNLVQQSPFPKIFMVTNSDDPRDVKRAKAMSFLTDFISKPLSEDDLIEKIMPCVQVA